MSGEALTGWTPRPRPQRVVHRGRHCRLEPLDAARHGDDLFAAASDDAAAERMRFIPDEPPESREAFETWLRYAEASPDPMFFAVVVEGRAVGRLSLMRMEPAHGVVETGHLHFGPELQRTPAATEAVFLLARHVFDELGYRRFEWKCNDLNEPSKRAALRLGFQPEGVFRQHMVVKGRSRDTAWFSMLDREWPPLRDSFERWLDPANFDEQGRQRLALRDVPAVLEREDPLLAELSRHIGKYINLFRRLKDA